MTPAAATLKRHPCHSFKGSESLVIEGVQNMPCPNILLGYIDHFGLKAPEKQQMREELSGLPSSPKRQGMKSPVGKVTSLNQEEAMFISGKWQPGPRCVCANTSTKISLLFLPCPPATALAKPLGLVTTPPFIFLCFTALGPRVVYGSINHIRPTFFHFLMKIFMHIKILNTACLLFSYESV